MTIEEAFGIVIKRLRRERGITQDVLSSASMLDRAFISKIENGKQQPSLITIVELAKALNVSVSNIFFELQFILELNHPESFKAESKLSEAKWFHDGDMMVKSFNDYSGSETLMVVDDESLIRQMLSDFLIEYGYKVITAKNGAEAIEKYQQDHIFDLIIMDVVMPVMDGITAFRELRKINEQAKVLLISGYTNQQLNNVEIAHCLQKPFSPLDLLKTIREILDGPK